jgi:hypothetical protein
VVDEPEIEARSVYLGEYPVASESSRVDVDPAAYSAVCPTAAGSACTGGWCSGRLVARWSDREEPHTAGDVYVIPPGHWTGPALLPTGPIARGGTTAGTSTCGEEAVQRPQGRPLTTVDDVVSGASIS